MNSFLRINKKILLLLLIVISGIFFINIFFERLNIANIYQENLVIDPKFDIVNPTFTINNGKEKILISAKKGNFLSKNIILLKSDVYFESKRFKIFSDEVTFDRKKQTANSKKSSKFKSEGTEITSEGFSIIEQGDIILFDGKTVLMLNQ